MVFNLLLATVGVTFFGVARSDEIQGALVLSGAELSAHTSASGLGAERKTEPAPASAMVARFKAAPDGSNGSYKVSIDLPSRLARSSGSHVVHLEIKLSGWRNINYLAYGWRYLDGRFIDIKNSHPAPDDWFSERLDPSGYERIISDYAPLDGSEGKLEIYLKGRPSRGGGEIWLRRVSLTPISAPTLVIDGRRLGLSADCDNSAHCLTSSVARHFSVHHNLRFKHFVEEYNRALYADAGSAADVYMKTGEIRLRGVTPIRGDWRKGGRG